MSKPLCNKYVGDNDGTCPWLGCIRTRGHTGPCDNVCGDEDESPPPDEPGNGSGGAGGGER